MTKLETRVGLTPALKRIAYYYLRLGEGVYTPDGGRHPHYDRVVVRPLYEFTESAQTPGEYAGGSIVEFYWEGSRIRWVEFRNQVIGGGGHEIVKSV